MADVVMPQLGETVTEGTITRWFKQPGDEVAIDEVLFEVSTDKVDSEVPSPAAGVLHEIVVAEGETVDVGVVLARIGDAAAAPAPAAAQAPEVAAEPPSDLPPPVLVPPTTEVGSPPAAPAPAAPAAAPAPAAVPVPATSHHDVIVIGGGPAGYAAALYGAAAGLDFALVEMDKLGGTCLHVGCIPAKELLETAAVVRTIGHADEFGITVGEPSIDFGQVQVRKNKVIDTLTAGVSGLLKHRKVTIYDGVGTLGANRTVTVTGADGAAVAITADHVVLASGSSPRTLPGFEIDGVNVMTSDEVLSLDHVPDRVAIIGGGAIGCEFASMLLDVGSDVTLLEYMPNLIPGADIDCSRVVERAFKGRGMTVNTGVAVSGWEQTADGLKVNFGEGDSVIVDKIAVSVGRAPRSGNLALDGTAVQVDERGFVEIDPLCRTHEPHVYAVGDLVNTAQLAHVGFAEGMMVVKDMLGETPLPIDYGNVPWCIYCHPEVAFAGMTEQQAKDEGFDVVVSKHKYSGNGRAMIIGETDGLVKVIAEKLPDGTGGRILGVHMAGPWVTEQLGQGYMAVNWEATVNDVAQFIQPHPTLSELFGETVLALTGRSLHG